MRVTSELFFSFELMVEILFYRIIFRTLAKMLLTSATKHRMI